MNICVKVKVKVQIRSRAGFYLFRFLAFDIWLLKGYFKSELWSLFFNKRLFHFERNFLYGKIIKHLFFSLYKDELYSSNELFFYHL